MILRICDRFGCVPSQAEREDAGVLRLLEIESVMGWRRTEGGE